LGAITVIDPAGPVELDHGVARLVAGACDACGGYSFPLRERCETCGAALHRILLPTTGTLWTWTTQEFEPSSPPYLRDPPRGEFEPFAVGYVEFDGFLRAEGRLTERDPDRLRIGMPMQVVALKRGRRLGYAFAPADSSTTERP